MVTNTKGFLGKVLHKLLCICEEMGYDPSGHSLVGQYALGKVIKNPAYYI